MPNKDQHGGSGNFANDPKRASEMGKKGSEQAKQQSQSSEKTPQQGSHGSQNKDRDPSHKGGQR